MENQYDKLVAMMNTLNLQDDGIIQNVKFQKIRKDFCNIVKDEAMLNESMDYINDKALESNDASLKFALLFSSRFFDSLAIDSLKVRSKLMSLLEKNFLNFKRYMKDDRTRLCNSITLLGECYNRIRTSQNDPIHILGESLLNLLTETVKEDYQIDEALSRVILSQITINGSHLKQNHKEEVDELLFHIRRNLIKQNNMTETVKALLLMTLDLQNNKISNLSKKLLEMYTEYLQQVDNPTEKVTPPAADQPKKWSDQVVEDNENVDENNSNVINQPPVEVRKKWSEEVEEFDNDNDEQSNDLNASQSPRQQQWSQPRYNRREASQEKTSPRSQEQDSQNKRSPLKVYDARERIRSRQSNNNFDNKPRNNQIRKSYWEHDSRNDDEDDHEERNEDNLSRRNEGNRRSEGNFNRRNSDKFNRRNSNQQRNTYEVPPRFRQKQLGSSNINNAPSQSRDCSETRAQPENRAGNKFNPFSQDRPGSRGMIEPLLRNKQSGRNSRGNTHHKSSRNSNQGLQNQYTRSSSQSSLASDHSAGSRNHD